MASLHVRPERPMGCGVATDGVSSAEVFKVLLEKEHRGDTTGVVVDERDVVFFLRGEDRGGVVRRAEANGFSGFIEDDADVGRGRLREFEDDTTVGLEGVGVVEVVRDEDETFDEEGPVADDLCAAGDTLEGESGFHHGDGIAHTPHHDWDAGSHERVTVAPWIARTTEVVPMTNCAVLKG